jgi:hypothetical protein
MEPDEAARIIADGVLEGKPEVSFPLRLALAMKLLGSAPGAVARPATARLARRLRR